MKIKVKPLQDRVLVQPVEADERTKSGIILPDSAKEKSQEGKVVAVGPGKTGDDGKVIPVSVKVGDIVLYSKYGGTDIKHNGEEYLILREDDILAIVG